MMLSEFLLQQNHTLLPGIPCIPSLVDGHAGHSHFRIAMNTAAVDVRMYTFVLFGMFEISFQRVVLAGLDIMILLNSDVTGMLLLHLAHICEFLCKHTRSVH